MNEKQLREDIYNELFDSGRKAMAIPDPEQSLDARCYKDTNNIMKHILGHIPKIKSVDENLQALLKASSDAVAIQGDRINKAVAYLNGLSCFGTAQFSKDIVEAIIILLGNDYATEMQQTEMDSIKARGF